MSRERLTRGMELCRVELNKARAARDRSAAHYWALQWRDNREWLKRLGEQPESWQQG